MQTFLPYPNFRQTAACLDSRRLGKQRVEAYQILRTLQNPAQRGWQRHPAVLMWRGYEEALRDYMNAMIQEWVRRGFRNTMAVAAVTEPPTLPPWLGEPALHAAHRANLLRKDPAFYGQYGWSEPPDLPFIWPVALERA
ncbi:MAG TPA: MSMEG_6728 family protein [Ktedonobacterales bacterium]|nr:MSMEG_6728 family protein [Ktedonobacterales bacterium]